MREGGCVGDDEGPCGLVALWGLGTWIRCRCRALLRPQGTRGIRQALKSPCLALSLNQARWVATSASLLLLSPSVTELVWPHQPSATEASPLRRRRRNHNVTSGAGACTMRVTVGHHNFCTSPHHRGIAAPRSRVLGVACRKPGPQIAEACDAGISAMQHSACTQREAVRRRLLAEQRGQIRQYACFRTPHLT